MRIFNDKEYREKMFYSLFGMFFFVFGGFIIGGFLIYVVFSKEPFFNSIPIKVLFGLMGASGLWLGLRYINILWQGLTTKEFFSILIIIVVFLLIAAAPNLDWI